MARILTIISCLVALMTVIGGLMAADARYAKEQRLCKVEQRLEQKILTDRLFQLRQRMWNLEDHYGIVPAQSMEEYRLLKQELELLDRNLRGN
jgi:hypothetical protein